MSLQGGCPVKVRIARGLVFCALVGSSSLTHGQGPASAPVPSPDIVMPGELVIEPATLHQPRFRVVHPGRCQPQRGGGGVLPQDGHDRVEARAAAAALERRAHLRGIARRRDRAQHVRRQRSRPRARIRRTRRASRCPIPTACAGRPNASSRCARVRNRSRTRAAASSTCIRTASRGRRPSRRSKA